MVVRLEEIYVETLPTQVQSNGEGSDDDALAEGEGFVLLKNDIASVIPHKPSIAFFSVAWKEFNSTLTLGTL